jgi:hypothetical protein
VGDRAWLLRVLLRLANDGGEGVKKPIVYIAGPFRGPNTFAIAENIRIAERRALEVWKLGGVALCPHLNTANFQGALPDHTWLEGDLVLLSACQALLTTYNWGQSEGARGEVEFAQKHGIPVFHSVLGLQLWMMKREGLI